VKPGPARDSAGTSKTTAVAPGFGAAKMPKTWRQYRPPTAG
jgi:hypothetical protein